MRYYIRIFLKGHENCQEVKAKILKNSLFIKGSFTIYVDKGEVGRGFPNVYTSK